ncbi:MAG: MoaD/ThiS family protein [Pirellulales bacterium]|nr:MoaD/ThiS family protein [Pirellulales bacterium]
MLAAINACFPGVMAKLVDGDQVRAGLSVVINDKPQPRGLETRVAADAEIHFLPPISGG